MFAAAAILLNFDAAFACSTKSKAYAAVLKSDLRNVVDAQERFHQDNRRYAWSVAELGSAFQKSASVATVSVQPTADGFVARSTHAQMSGLCVVYMGTKPADLTRPAGVRDREPWCENLVSFADAARKTDERIATAIWISLFVLALATALFLSQRGQRSWPSRGILLIALAYPLFMFPLCGGPALRILPFFLIPAALLFAFALHRRIVPREV